MGAIAYQITSDRWIPRTNGQLRVKCFHLMTSPWPFFFSYTSHNPSGRTISILANINQYKTPFTVCELVDHFEKFLAMENVINGKREFENNIA